ncbi:MAG: hypothetical protein WAN08_04435, partial [Candidatus Sulfotelmatobacter sp.]
DHNRANFSPFRRRFEGTAVHVNMPEHVAGLLAYLSQPDEKANEDRALTYFRKVYGDAFTRQEEAERADGYVPGSFVLELRNLCTSLRPASLLNKMVA